MCKKLQDETCHIPVLCTEVLECLRASEGGTFLDCTLGGGGHTQSILEANENNYVVALDRDKRAVERAKQRLAEYGSRVEIFHSSFSELESVVEERKFTGVLADLGISSDQLREERGFAFSDNGLLDMRMDESQKAMASEIINETEKQELFVVLKRGGVGKEARAVVNAIAAARPIETAAELSSVISKALAGKMAQKKTNPATVVFQAIRMAVNDELGEIDKLMTIVPKIVKSGGHFSVISFHSLEDKAVTSKMRKWENPNSMPALWPGASLDANPEPVYGKLKTRKAITPSAEEIKKNPRARSARLRVFEFGAV